MVLGLVHAYSMSVLVNV